MIKSIAIDDEPKALEVIEIHASKIPYLELLASFTDPKKALEYVKQNYFDLIFLDINMPGLSGLEFINQLQHKPHIIFTTAYSDFALESYDYEAIDYLLKPIEFDRFYKAIQKVERLIQLQSLKHDNSFEKSIFVKDGYKKVRVEIDEILYIKSEGNYLKIVCPETKILTRLTFQQVIEKLPANLFIRIHYSYIINLSRIDKIENNHIFISDTQIPVGASYKNELEFRLNLFSL